MLGDLIGGCCLMIIMVALLYAPLMF